MPIWSLTKERVEKLLKQIRDMEAEIDTLITLTREDLWLRDLDAFINEWRIQLDEEAKLQKKVANMGRRASSKLKIDAKGPARRRKAQGEDPDDSDFGNIALTKKPAVAKRVQSKVGLLSHLSPLAKPKSATSAKAKKEGATAVPKKPEEALRPKKPSDDVWKTLDGASDSEAAVAPIFQKAKAAAQVKKPIKLESDNKDEEIVRPSNVRKPRAAAKKAPTYDLSDSDSNGDDLLFDVGNMVKGIENTSTDQTSSARPLFSTSMSRPGSSAGLPKKSNSSLKQAMDLDGDDTDYSKLAPPAVKNKGLAVKAKDMVLSDDDVFDDTNDDSFLAKAPSPPPRASRAPKAVVSKTAPKPRAPAAAAKKTSQTTLQPSKKPTLSPAAKAYAAKRARNAAVMLDDDDDEVDKVANEIMNEGDSSIVGDVDPIDDDDDDDELVVRRPARRAAAAKAVEKGKKVWGGGTSDEDEDNDDAESDGFDEDDSE